MSLLDVRNLIRNKIKKAKSLDDISSDYHVINVLSFYDVHGFIFDLKRFNYFKNGFIIVLYAKIHKEEKLLVINNIYEDYLKSIEKLKYYTSYFPFYGYSSNNNI